MSLLPTDIQTYLLYRLDAVMRARLEEQSPGLAERVQAPETRQLLLEWLRDPEACQADQMLVAAAALQFLYAARDEREAAIVAALLGHASPLVRLRAYETLLIPLFASGDMEPLKTLLRGMLEDGDEMVRAAGARYLRRTATAPDLRSFLEAWRAEAREHGRAATESFALVERLLEEG